MKISRLSAFGIISFIAFLFCLLFNYNGWRLEFWAIRLSYIIFFMVGLAIFFRPKNRLFTKILSWFFPVAVVLVPIGFSFGGIFMALVLGLLLFPIVGPTFQSKQSNYVIQRPYQGFLGSATRFELVKKENIFEKKLFIFQADTAQIGSFKFDSITQKLSLNNGQQVVYPKDHVN